MTLFLASLYLAGLMMMLIGLIASPASEREAAKRLPTVLAYLFWPLSLAAVVAAVVYARWLDGAEAPSEHVYG
jgi:hypothetical protein